MTEEEDIVCDIQDLNIEEYDYVLKNDRLYVLKLKEDPEKKIKVNFVIKKAVVKYLPTKYDKLVFLPDPKDNVAVVRYEEFQKYAEDDFDIPVQKFVRDGTMSVKCTGSNKENICKLNQGDVVDLVISFDAICNVVDKWYPIFNLIEFRKIRNAPKKKSMFLD